MNVHAKKSIALIVGHRGRPLSIVTEEANEINSRRRINPTWRLGVCKGQRPGTCTEGLPVERKHAFDAS